MGLFERLHADLELRKAQGNYRELPLISYRQDNILFDSSSYIDLASNDYLCVARDSSFINQFFETFTDKEASGSKYAQQILSNFINSGSTGSRLLTGNQLAYTYCEDLLASLFSRSVACPWSPDSSFPKNGIGHSRKETDEFIKHQPISPSTLMSKMDSTHPVAHHNPSSSQDQDNAKNLSFTQYAAGLESHHDNNRAGNNLNQGNSSAGGLVGDRSFVGDRDLVGSVDSANTAGRSGLDGYTNHAGKADYAGYAVDASHNASYATSYTLDNLNTTKGAYGLHQSANSEHFLLEHPALHKKHDEIEPLSLKAAGKVNPEFKLAELDQDNLVPGQSASNLEPTLSLAGGGDESSSVLNGAGDGSNGNVGIADTANTAGKVGDAAGQEFTQGRASASVNVSQNAQSSSSSAALAQGNEPVSTPASSTYVSSNFALDNGLAGSKPKAVTSQKMRANSYMHPDGADMDDALGLADASVLADASGLTGTSGMAGMVSADKATGSNLSSEVQAQSLGLGQEQGHSQSQVQSQYQGLGLNQGHAQDQAYAQAYNQAQKSASVKMSQAELIQGQAASLNAQAGLEQPGHTPYHHSNFCIDGTLRLDDERNAVSDNGIDAVVNTGFDAAVNVGDNAGSNTEDHAVGAAGEIVERGEKDGAVNAQAQGIKHRAHEIEHEQNNLAGRGLNGLDQQALARDCLYLNSGFDANYGILATLFGEKDLLLVDKLAHASIIDGMLQSKAKTLRFAHNDMEHLEHLLKTHAHKYENVVIVTEAVFSMDGDRAKLTEIVALKHQYSNVLIYVDEAHSFGLLGEGGLGLCQELHLLDDVDFIMGTLSKAIGSQGAFLICPRIVKQYLVNYMRNFIYSTALPPLNVAFSMYIVGLLNTTVMQYRRDYLNKICNYLHLNLLEMDLTPSESQIQPLITGDNDKAVYMSEVFKSSGLLALPIRHPTVPLNKVRLRITLNCNLRIDDVDLICSLIRRYRNMFVA